MNTPDFQTALDWLAVPFLAIAGWVAKTFHDRLNGHDAEFKQLPDKYARRDDVKEGFQRIEATLARIETRMDGKADL